MNNKCQLSVVSGSSNPRPTRHPVKPAAGCPRGLNPQSAIRNPQSAFTLVELLVVITIIGVLVSLITVAAIAALRTAERTQIKAEINSIHDGFEKYARDISGGAYPPNLVVDDNSDGAAEVAATPISETQVYNALRQHLAKAFPQHREPDNLLRLFCGLNATGATAVNYSAPLEGGITAGEAVVFWLGGFSEDQYYPISGDGGPAYRVTGLPAGVAPNEADPIENRNWVFPFEISRLAPRNEEGYFNDLPEFGARFITYVNPRDTPAPETLRLNFWQYLPGKSSQPVLYFDVSRGDPTLPADDPPSLTWNDSVPWIYALKTPTRSDATGPTAFKFANKGKFQLIHSGIDDEWGDIDILDIFLDGRTNLLRLDVNGNGSVQAADRSAILTYPAGPFGGELGDTIVNFSDSTLEDSQEQ